MWEQQQTAHHSHVKEDGKDEGRGADTVSAYTGGTGRTTTGAYSDFQGHLRLVLHGNARWMSLASRGSTFGGRSASGETALLKLQDSRISINPATETSVPSLLRFSERSRPRERRPIAACAAPVPSRREWKKVRSGCAHCRLCRRLEAAREILWLPATSQNPHLAWPQCRQPANKDPRAAR